jgi:hypothetical protein
MSSNGGWLQKAKLLVQQWFSQGSAGNTYQSSSGKADNRFWTIILGGNQITECDAALVVNGVEVFRLQRSTDKRLVVDFEVRDDQGSLVAKVSKNNVVFARPNVQVSHGTNFSEVLDSKTGHVFTRVEEISPQTISVIGTFIVDGFRVVATKEFLQLGGITLRGCTISGFGKALQLGPGGAFVGG